MVERLLISIDVSSIRIPSMNIQSFTTERSDRKGLGLFGVERKVGGGSRLVLLY